MGCRIVVPDVVVLPLSDGDSLTVKARLNSGEHREMIRGGVSYGPDGDRTFDPLRGALAKILAYLVDWTFRGPDGRVVLIRDQGAAVVTEALAMIDPDSYTEVLRAIEAHETAQEADRAAKKKTPDGSPTLLETSRSLVAAGGGMSGSST